MSCQQVPRLAEDPYIFTETTTTPSTSVYNPQIHKLTPILSASSSSSSTLTKKQLLAKKSQIISQNKINQSQRNHLIQQQKQQQLFTSRINGGVTQTVNALQKNNVNQNAVDGFQKQFQLRCQQQQQKKQQPTKVVSNSSTQQKKYLSSSTTSTSQSQFMPANETVFNQPHSIYSTVSKQNSSISTAITTQNIPPPFYQKTSTAITASSSQSTNLPLSIENKSSQLLRNHSNKTIQGNATIRNPQQFIALPSNASSYHHHQHKQQSTLTTSNYTSTISRRFSQQQLQQLQQQQQQQQQLINSSNVQQNDIFKSVLNSTQIKNEKLSDNNTDNGIFLAPSKKNSKVSFSTRKLLKNQQQQQQQQSSSSLSQNVKMKRSYSQNIHHEALQRISTVGVTSGTGSSSSVNNEWHAPDSYIFDNILPFPLYFNSDNYDNYDTIKCVQYHWLNVADILKSTISSSVTTFTREQRIELHKAQLRRQAIQNIVAQRFRNNLNAKKRFICVSKALKKLKDRDEVPPSKKCCFPDCLNNALALTAYCYLHITRNTDQYLFLPCTAKFSDNSQCRIPVFDITHELPLCREHAWKRDNYNRIIQEQKPKKSSSRKRPKSISSNTTTTRPQKRKQKRRKTTSSSSTTTTTPAATTTTVKTTDNITNNLNVNSNNIQELSIPFHKTTTTNYVQQQQRHHYHHHRQHNQMKLTDSTNYNKSLQITTTTTSTTALNQVPIITQDMLTVCENSSAYESSEDTGVGGLSESELMVGAHDVIEEIPLSDTRLLEEHDLTNVLNQLPVDAFNELFTTVQQNGPLEPTQEEQEDLERALEAVNKQVKSLQQMTGGDSAFLGDFLDVDDQILDDTDICTEVVLNSPDTSGIDTSNILIDGGGSGSNHSSNSIIIGSNNDRRIIMNDEGGGGGSGSGGCHTTTGTSSDIRELVQT